MNDLTPRLSLERALRRWWIVAAAVCLGGLFAWLFSRVQAPVYAATAGYQVLLDEQQIADREHLTADDLPLDPTTKNVYLEPVSRFFELSRAPDDLSRPDIRSRLLDEARSLGIALVDADIAADNFDLDRRSGLWLLTVRSTDPENAARIANLWVTVADALLREAQVHCARAFVLLDQRLAIQGCFRENDFPQANLCAGTDFFGPADLEAHLDDLQREISAEQALGWNIDPALSFTFTQPASAPSQPVLYDTALLLLAGSLIGLVLGVILAQAGPGRKGA